MNQLYHRLLERHVLSLHDFPTVNIILVQLPTNNTSITHVINDFDISACSHAITAARWTSSTPLHKAGYHFNLVSCTDTLQHAFEMVVRPTALASSRTTLRDLALTTHWRAVYEMRCAAAVIPACFQPMSILPQPQICNAIRWIRYNDFHRWQQITTNFDLPAPPIQHEDEADLDVFTLQRMQNRLLRLFKRIHKYQARGYGTIRQAHPTTITVSVIGNDMEFSTRIITMAWHMWRSLLCRFQATRHLRQRYVRIFKEKIEWQFAPARLRINAPEVFEELDD